MSDALRLFILAGEPSGDRIAADLVRRLRERVAVGLSGVGGTELMGQGLEPIFPMDDIAVMGITDVLRQLPALLRRVEETAQAIARTKPDIVVLVDAQDFSKRVAKRAKALGFAGRMILYVAPAVWARSPKRAKKLKPLFDEILTVLPFEPAVFLRLAGPPAVYVGHPTLGEVKAATTARESGLVALLPGSRGGELRRHLPTLRALTERLAVQPNITGFFMPTLPHLHERLVAETSSWAAKVEIISDRSQRPAFYADTLFAITSAGTATLELAMAGIPLLLIYGLGWLEWTVFASHGSPPVGLPNIMAGRNVTPEFVRRSFDIEALTREALTLATDKAARQKQVEAFGELVADMQNGAADWPRQDPADRVRHYWRKA